MDGFTKLLEWNMMMNKLIAILVKNTLVLPLEHIKDNSMEKLTQVTLLGTPNRPREQGYY